MAPKTIAVRIDSLLYRKLRQLAKGKGHSIKWLMSQAIIQYLGNEKWANVPEWKK